MRIEIVDKKENVLLHRDELFFQVNEVEKTPSREEVRQKLIALTNSTPNLVVVQKINSEYGSHKFSGQAKIYKEEKYLKEIELPYIKKRNFKEETKKESTGETVPVIPQVEPEKKVKK